jgi:serine/threonine protein kinase
MLLAKERNAEPIPGYRLLEPLGSGGFGEVWKCEAPGGLFKAIKFVPGHLDAIDAGPAPATEELKAIQHIKSLRHPFLLSMERVEVIGNELVIVMELADKNLQELLHERQAAGRPGIDRDELLGYLREAADVLDLMNRRHSLQHLDIKPGNLFLVSDHVKVADFGLVRSLADLNGAGSKASLGAVSALYAAPELFRNCMSSTSDQYSLAIAYQELLTGTLPFSGGNARQLMLKHCMAEPDLSALPEADRPAVQKALSKDPAQRFASCMEFLRALEDTGGGALGPVSPSATRPEEAETKHEALAVGTAPVRPTHEDYLSGYQFQGCLGRTPTSETWETLAPEGGRRLVKFLFGVAGRDPAREEEAIRRLENLQHPALPEMRLVSAGPGCVAVVTEGIRETLRDRYQEQRGGASHGLPRNRLLGWLRAAAEALDELARQTSLQHQGLSPRHLLFDDDRLRIAEFGLLPLLWQPTGQLQGQLVVRYAAPELFRNQACERCDQYSLAVIYQEMLTGSLPWRGRRSGPPQLEPLPELDRAAVARALEEDPVRRFASCTDFVAALQQAGKEASDLAAEQEELNHGPAAVVAELIVEAGGGAALARPEMWSTSAEGDLQLRHHFDALLPVIGAGPRFEAFRRKWNAQTLREGENSLLLRVCLPGRFWQRWLGGTPALAIDLQWLHPAGAAFADLAFEVRAAERSGKVEDGVLREVAPLMLDHLRTLFEAHPERRSRQRLSWTHPVRAAFLQEDGRWSEPIEGIGKDLSLTGIGMYLPRVLPGPEVRLELTTPTRSEAVVLEGTCIRVESCADGRFQVGVAFE